MGRPADIVIERDDGAGQPLPVEAVQHRGSEAGEVDFDDLFGAEEFVKAAAEVTTRFDDERPRPADIEAHHLEKDRVGALDTMRDDDDRGPADSDCRARPEFEPQTGINPAPADANAVGQRDDLCGSRVGFGEAIGFRPIEPRLEARADATLMRFGRKGRVIEDAEQGVRDPGLMKCAQ